MKKNILIIDSIAFLAFLISLMPDFTGLDIHEWLGLAIGGVLLIHMLQHWQWILTVTQNLIHSKPKVWVKYVADFGLGVSVSIIMISGLLISTLLMLPLNDYETWRIIHVLSSYTTLALLGFKFALHWDWLSRTGAKWLAGKSVNDSNALERRKFIRTCFITGMAAIFAVAEFKEWQSKLELHSVIADNDESGIQGVVKILDPAITPAPLIDTVIDSSKDVDMASGNTPEADKIMDEPTATVEPTMAETVTLESTIKTVAITGVVRCNHGCSYPGKCRRYQDTITQNNKCDLGEAIW